MVKLNKDVIKNIKEFMYPTEEQMEIWKLSHYINYYKVLKDIEDVIMEVRIGKNADMKIVFSLFSWSILCEEFTSFSYTDEESSYSEDEEFTSE